MVYIYFTAFLLLFPSFATATKADLKPASNAFDLTNLDTKVCPGGYGQCPNKAYCCPSGGLCCNGT